MPLNHTFSLTMCNTKLVLKLSGLIIILLLIVFAVLSSVIMPMIKDIMEIIKSVDVSPDQMINHPIITLKEQFIDKCIAYIKASNWQKTLAVIIAVYFCFRFFLTVTQLPLTKVLHGKMCTGYDVGLFNAFIATGFQNLLLSFVLTVINTAVNIGFMAGFVALLRVCFANEVLVAVPFVILLVVALYSAKSCLLSQWMPEICASETKNIFAGIKAATRGTFVKFRKNFLCFYALNLIWVAIFASTLIPTFGAITLVGIPVFIVTRSILSLTLNFSYHTKKYFVDNGATVYTPEKKF